MRFDLDLRCDLEAPAEARQALSSLQGHVPAATLGDAKLLVSELVTNALRHAGMSHEDHIRLGVEADDGRLFVEVCDRGPGLDASKARRPPTGASSGYGLYLVETLADRWGINGEGETRVWFEMTTTPKPL